MSPKTPPPHTITLGVRILKSEFWGRHKTSRPQPMPADSMPLGQILATQNTWWPVVDKERCLPGQTALYREEFFTFHPRAGCFIHRISLRRSSAPFLPEFPTHSHRHQEGTKWGTWGQKEVAVTSQDLTDPWRWGAPTRHFISEPFLRVNEEVSSQPQLHYVKELLMACSISLTFMVILKPKWWTITLHSLQIKAGC